MKKECGVPAVNKSDLAKLKIPIHFPDNPAKSFEIQKEIVRILDAFTELTTEFKARKKQYNYYREQLLTFDLPAGQAGLNHFHMGLHIGQ